MNIPQSPIIDTTGRVRREWLSLFNGMISSIVAQTVAEMMSLFPDPSSALAVLTTRVEALELQQAMSSMRSEIDALRAEVAALRLEQAMRGDAAPASRRPING